MDSYRKHCVIGIGYTLNWTGAYLLWFYHIDEATEKEFCDFVPKDGWNVYYNPVGKTTEDIIALSKAPKHSVSEFLEQDRVQ